MSTFPRPGGSARGGRAPALRAPPPAVLVAADRPRRRRRRGGRGGADRAARRRRRRPRAHGPPAAVPAHTLVLSHALALAPDPERGSRDAGRPRRPGRGGRGHPARHPVPARLRGPLRLGGDAARPVRHVAASTTARRSRCCWSSAPAACGCSTGSSADAAGPGGGRDRARGRPGVAVPAARRRRLALAGDRRGGRARRRRGARRGAARRLLRRVSQPRSGART